MSLKPVKALTLKLMVQSRLTVIWKSFALAIFLPMSPTWNMMNAILSWIRKN